LTPVGHPFISDTERRFAPTTVRQDYIGVRQDLEWVSDGVRLRITGNFDISLINATPRRKFRFQNHFQRIWSTPGQYRVVFEISFIPLIDPLTAPRDVRRRPLLIIPSGQGRSSPTRSKTFHRARSTLTSDGHSESAERLTSRHA
jgi:hypothetical protein